MTNKRLTLVLEISFICLVTVRPLLSSVATLYHVNDQLQRAYYSLKLSPSSRSKHLTSSASSQPRPQVLLAFQYAAAILESEKTLGTRLCLVPKSYCRSKKEGIIVESWEGFRSSSEYSARKRPKTPRTPRN